MQTATPEPLYGTARPLSICLAPYARVPQNQAERDKLGALSLDWCLGFMTELGRRPWGIEDQALNYCPSKSDSVRNKIVTFLVPLYDHISTTVRQR